jgi:hypothetical protein
MNERILELAQQAGIVNRKYSFGQYWQGELTDEQKKFAELIVRECIEHLEGNVAVPNLEHSRTKAKCISSIKEHFGVEEQQKVVSKLRCSVCGTTENVKYMGGHQPYLCDSEDCIPY